MKGNLLVRGLGLALGLCTLATAFTPAQGAAQDAPAGGEQAAADDPHLTEARERISVGERFFDAGNFESALVEFERAYELLEGNPIRYFVLFNIGQCHERLFRYDRAIEYYERYLNEGGPEAEDRATVEATMRALTSLLASIEITSNIESAEVWIDDLSIGTFDAEHHTFRVPGGRHTIELRATGYTSSQQDIQILARTTQTLDFQLIELSTYEGLEPWIFWSSAGVGAALLVTGSVFGILALTKSGEAYGRQNDPIGVQMNTPALVSDIQQTQLIADVFFGTGALFGVTALVLAFLTDWDGPPARAAETPPSTPPAARLHLSPVFSGTESGLVLSGSF